MGREAMNAAQRSGRRRRRKSSKDPMAKKLDAKEKPKEELYKASFPPSIGASGFRFFFSSSKESLAGSKTATGTLRSAPPNARSVAAFDSKITAKAAGARTKFSRRAAATGLLRKQMPTKKELYKASFPPSIGASGFSFFDSSSKESLAGSKTATGTPRSAPPNARSVAFGSKIIAKAAGATGLLRKRSKKDPSPKIAHAMAPSSTTPPVQASNSPEVPAGSSLVTPACFAAGHVIVGVQDRRKCRPRGILSVGGGRELEIPEFNGGVADRTRLSVTPPSPAGASIHWLSSPSKLSSTDGDEIVIGTPSRFSGDSVSPFSSILERIAKTSGSKHEPEPQRHNASRQTTFSDRSFQFGSIETWSNSVERKIVPGDQTRTSWIYQWLSEDDDLDCLEEDGKNPGAKRSVEFVFEAEATGAKGKFSSAESISMEGIVLAASDDSDWTFSCKNQIF